MDDLVCPCGGRVFVEVRTVQGGRRWTGCAWCEECGRKVRDEREWDTCEAAFAGAGQRWREETGHGGG